MMRNGSPPPVLHANSTLDFDGRRRQTTDKFLPYKGVTFYKRTGRWESNIWFENKQHYLGASFTALEAARAYDKAILFTRSSTDQLNFPPQDYTQDVQMMRSMSFAQYKQYLRDRSREANCHIVNKSYKGILIDERGRWEVKYFLKNEEKSKYLLLGWYDTEEEALSAYNQTALRCDGPRAVIRSFQQKRTSNTRSTRRTRPRYKAPNSEATATSLEYPEICSGVADVASTSDQVTENNEVSSYSVDTGSRHNLDLGHLRMMPPFDIDLSL